MLRICAVLVLLPAILVAQAPKKYNAAEIQELLEKLNVLGSVMYVAAHPDDENTQMIAYFANERKYRTAYMSATRGDGGQNLIGPEIRELLGLIRTQELLAARRTDGGQQFFSRANDFGYSKDSDETLNIWDKEEVLSDFVWNIRKFRPDIIVTRFAPEWGGHGHHTTSAILALEAFDITNDASAYPDQLKHVQPWQPERMFWNISWWFFRNSDTELDTTQMVSLDIGEYNPLLGKSYNEIAAESRSQHKSQGFGSTGSRGTDVEYLKYWKGSEAQNDPFEGINTTWSRVKGGEEVALYTHRAQDSFDPSNPAAVVPDLIAAAKALEKLDDDFWKQIKLAEIKTLIKACTGMYMEVKANEFAAVPGDSLGISFEAINRSNAKVKLTDLRIDQLNLQPKRLDQQLDYNQPFNMDLNVQLPMDLPNSQPYWLIEEASLGMYNVPDQLLRGLPENEPSVTAEATVEIDGYYLDYQLPLVYKRNDPVDGEVYRPFVITPPVFMNIKEKVYVMASGATKEVTVKVTAGKDNISGNTYLVLPEGWTANPASYDFSMDIKGTEQEFVYEVIPPKNQSEGEVLAETRMNGTVYNSSLTTIEYDHFPIQTLFSKSTAKVVNIDIVKRGQNIGYIMGAGDEIPASLRQIGYNVWEMKDEDITDENLAGLDAVIMGVRAYNTEARLKFHQDKLMNFVKNGGNMIVQYNTNRRLVVDNIAPYPLTLSRDRVTVEEAPVRILAPDHPVITGPNKITEADFDGWVQERGLYFPDEWDERFVPILSSNDPGESPKDGGLLVAQYGEGYYIYSGYSWFRELPAGVSGAYRLFTNMISIGKEPALQEQNNIDTGKF